jgi:putative CocE/NonD family hydrolase
MTWSLPAPVGVKEIEHAWISMPDGVRLAMQLWLPDQATLAPAVLEAIPYRKRDSTRPYSRYWGRELARCGIVYARLDARGSGDSEGLLDDEYLPQEQHDCAEAIAWLARQPWCNGSVGMRGVSWGGFITLQTAALAPPALKAAMVFCASDRRYTDDAHYVGGSFALTGLKWATSMKLVQAGPPDPETFGPDWERAWRERLEAAPAIAARWLSHQREDDYWRQASVSLDYAAIRSPLYLVGGWADPYNEAIARLLANLEAPGKGLIGPWGHGYPAPATPGPGLVWIAEEARWWRHWLMGEETGVMEGPRLWSYMPDESPAQAAPGPIPGRWVAAPNWPAAAEPLVLGLAQGRLVAEASEAGRAEIRSDAGVGLATPEWCPFSSPQYPHEQSDDDARSTVFDLQLEGAVEILGAPTLRLRVAASMPVARIAARICEVTDDGRSHLITYGVLNLTHRRSHADPSPLTPGVFYDVDLPLYLTARRLQAGSRLRLALSESLWPLLWPSPEPVQVTIDLGGSSLTLPLRTAVANELAFPVPLAETPPASGRGGPEIVRRLTPDGRMAFEEVWPPSATTITDTGTVVERSGTNVAASVDQAEPTSGHWRAWQTVRYRRGDWDCALEAEVDLTSTAALFHIRERLTARRGADLVFEREEQADIPRDLM